MDQTSNFYIFYSDQPFASTNINATLGQSGVTYDYYPTTISRPLNVVVNRTAQYIRVHLNQTNHLSLTEVEVLGCLVSASVENKSYDQMKLENQSDLTFYPNPTSNLVFAKNLEGLKKIYLKNVDGRVMKYFDTLPISLQEFHSGIYLLAVEYKDQLRTIHRIVKF